ncbi:sulfatase-like hydrolase/transferase [Propionivibrio sp.]|uniref:sulfatase-like hydrolase/transferase n=1 Tax=Propionivibrio sp. TaxID=2212460 RepID=UPI0025F0A52C|nr:sulfatase-like hydrolase/transferase [Propionivibrio sp.]MBK7357040.1 sulfatase-like hydrolase/transferase [Propionivibrio sp.]
MLTVAQLRRVLAYFFLLTYVVLLGITWDGIDFAWARSEGALTFGFAVAVWLTYGLIYLLPALLITGLVEKLVHRQREHGHKAVFYPLAVLSTGITTLFFYANAKLYTLYGMFINSFVINLVSTPGGLESLGASTASKLTFVAIAAAFLLLQALLLAATLYAYRRFGEPNWIPRRFFTGLLILFAVTTVGERLVYAYTTATGVASISSLTLKVPYYLGLSARGVLHRLGVKVKRSQTFQLAQGNLNYPLHPLEVTTPAAPLNIVWLVSESWRADTLDAEIMPHTWAFAQNAQRFTHNYSGGNGTRVGMFTMFTGIPGSYWFPVLAERKGAPLIDVLKSQNYQMSFYTSAKFSYPEFDATIFSQVPTEQLHEIAGGAPGWEKDQQNVAHLLKFIDTRDKHRPFFTFMFFESPHARYYFPPESVIRTPYLDDINYFTLSKSELASQIHLIKNRYLNSVHHLDSQFGRVFDYLKQHDLLKNTVVLMLGDHGEEFLENGRWGHNSAFTDQQTRTPLVLWVPGMKPSVYEGMSNHMDVIPMLMPMLGVKNPQQDYTTGFNLLAGETRDHAVIAEWSSTGYIDRDAKITLPLSVVAAQHPLVTGPHDEVLSPQEQDALFARKAKNLAAMLEELGRYLKKSKSGK